MHNYINAREKFINSLCYLPALKKRSLLVEATYNAGLTK